MNKFLAPLSALLLTLTGCQTLNSGISDVATPQRCEDAIRTVQTLQALVDVLIRQGFHPNDAQAVANILAQGSVSIQAVCSYADTHRNPEGVVELPADPVA